MNGIHCSNCGRTRRSYDDFVVNDGRCASCTMHHRQNIERSNEEASEREHEDSLHATDAEEKP